MIDGVINNGRRGEELEKTKPSIRERLEDAKTGVCGAQAHGEGTPRS